MMTSNVARSIALPLLLLFAGCTKNDCDHGSMFDAITYRDLDAREADDEKDENRKWYWCEAPVAKGQQIPDGYMGPLIHSASGAEYTMGKWVRAGIANAAMIQDVLGGGVAGTDRSTLMMMYSNVAAAVEFVYGSVSQDSILVYYEVVTTTKKRPGGVTCYRVDQMIGQLDDWNECKSPAGNSPITQSGASGSTSGGSTSGGAGESN